MRVLSTVARTMLDAQRWAAMRWRTVAYSGVAGLEPGARILATGRVSNIGRRADAIAVGAHSLIAGELLTFAHGGRIRIGDWCYVGENSRIWSAAEVKIGARVLISHDVNVHDCDAHSIDPALRHAQFREIATRGHPSSPPDIAAGAIVIEDDVWIGFGASVLKGCRIGARSIIAAGSVVTSQVPPDSLYVGTSVRRKLNAAAP